MAVEPIVPDDPAIVLAEPVSPDRAMLSTLVELIVLDPAVAADVAEFPDRSAGALDEMPVVDCPVVAELPIVPPVELPAVVPSCGLMAVGDVTVDDVPDDPPESPVPVAAELPVTPVPAPPEMPLPEAAELPETPPPPLLPADCANTGDAPRTRIEAAKARLETRMKFLLLISVRRMPADKA